MTRILWTIWTIFCVAALYGGFAKVSSTQATERTRCQEALKLGLEESIPGPGWTVVIKIPGKEHTPQRLCSDPQINKEQKQVVCLAEVAGVGDARQQDPMRQVDNSSLDEPEVAALLEWSMR